MGSGRSIRRILVLNLDIAPELGKIEVNTTDTNILLEEINNNTKVSAYYNAKEAKYSEIIANRTQTLVFLKAMLG